MFGTFAAAAAREAPAKITTTLFNTLAVAVACTYNAKRKTPNHRDKYVPPVLFHKIHGGSSPLVHFVHHHADFMQSGGVGVAHNSHNYKIVIRYICV